jgi:hypothetical protein
MIVVVDITLTIRIVVVCSVVEDTCWGVVIVLVVVMPGMVLDVVMERETPTEPR